MVRVRHSGDEVALDPSSLTHLGDVIDACTGGEARVVSRVRVDGCEIPEESLDKLESFPLEGIDLIEVETRSTYEVAVSSLASSALYAGALVRSLRDTSLHLRSGRVEEANRLYAETTDALGVFLFAVSAAARVLGPPAEPLEGLEGELQPWLEQLVDAQRDRDWLRVADYLEFEIAELVGDWRRRIEQLREGIASSDPAGREAAHVDA